MDHIVGRTDEQNILEEIFKSRRPEFLAVYGRRRVGKTYLIRNFFQNKKAIFFNATGSLKSPMLEQISNFTTRIGEIFYDGAELSQKKNWNSVFKILNEAIKRQDKNQKIILFFDEFPWMATKNSRLLQILDYYWNQYWSQDNRIKLIICGSSASWIIEKIINHKGGLHNRITHSILLEPYNLKETKEFLTYKGLKLNNSQVTELYMALGGVPYYLTKLEKNLSVNKNIEKLAFRKKGFLFNEFNNLFSSLFEDSEFYIEIIRYLAQKKSGMNQKELFKKIKSLSKGGRFSQKLKALEDAGFIMSFTPHLRQRKGIYYRVIDEYTLFYLNWIEPIKKTLSQSSMKEHYWEVATKSPAWESWAGYAFEAICYKHLTQISDALHLSPTAIPTTWRYISKKSFNEHGAQIDLLFDRQDDAITICEIKYTKKPFIIDKSYAATLNRKIEVFKKQTRLQKQIFIAFVSANGLKPTVYSEEMVSRTVTLDDLFK